MKGIGTLAILGIIVLVVIVAIGAYAWIELGRYVHLGSQKQSFAVLSANQTVPISQVAQNMTAGFGANQLEVEYSGSTTVSIYGIQVTLPLNVSLAKYYNDSRVAVEAQDIPVLGNVSAMQIGDGSAYYNCASGLNSSQKGYSCSVQAESGSLFSVLALAANGSSAGGLGSDQVHFGTINQSSHDGMPCTNVDGYFNYSNSTELGNINSNISKVGQHVVQQVSEVNVSFASCVSSQYRIPLTMKIYALAKTGNTITSASLQISEAEFSTNSSAAIASLPGPITNQTR